MAIHGVSFSESEEVILPSDPGHPEHPAYKAAEKAGKKPETPTKFKIANLTKASKIELGDIGTSPTMRNNAITIENLRTKKAFECVQRALRGWSNFTDENGKAIPFEMGTVATIHGTFIPAASDDSMSRLPFDVVFELAELILEKNGMTRQVEKNLENLSPLLNGDSLEIGDAANAQSNNNESEDVPKKQ